MKIIILVFGIFLLSGCQNSEKSTISQVEDAGDIQDISHPGKQLMETYCYSCHGPAASHDDRLAPPMFAVKRHYLRGGTSEEEFKLEVQNWVKNPGEEHARMFGAVKEFGAMPKMAIPDEAVVQIADYLYNNAIDKPQCCTNGCESQGMGKGMGRKQYGRKKG